MILSMTGFGHREIAQEGFRGSLDLKSYNNRYLDLTVYLPPYLARLEPRFRSFLSARIVHGKIELSLRIRELDVPVAASADNAAAKAVSQVLVEMAEACGIPDKPRIADILSFDGVVAYERIFDEDDLWTRISSELEACFAEYDASRRREGEATAADISVQLDRVEGATLVVRALLPEIERTVRTQIESRFAEVMGDSVDEGRALAEVAPMLMKYSINEELARLDAHISSFRAIMAGERAPGKKLDFLCQEMNREVNTVGSKSILLPVSRAVVELKDALENVREQLRNVE
jgi:uncharacterized protein (TIGR00255 family)